MVTHTRAPEQPTQKLAFNEKLVGKGHTTDTLLKKLKSLHTQLADLDQELIDVNSLSGVRKELINTSILLHKDRGVKAYAACCLADILRLYAPDAPYTQSELRDIFSFFLKQLTIGLKSMESSYYNEYFHLLESLSTVKSIVLVCDLVNAEELLTDIFRDFFGMIRRDLAKKIEIFMADILVALVDECHTLPSEVLDILMTQFMEDNARMDQPAFRLAVQVCNATADKLQRHVCQYFTDIIVSHAQDEEMDEIRTAHDLIKRINRSCPALLHSVVPQLEEELRLEELHLRLMATGVLGEIFSDKAGADSVKKYPTTWNAWLLRKNDRSAAIRLKFIEAARGCLVNLPEHREAIEDALKIKLMDPDDKVRAAVCKVYSQLDYETALHHVSETQLRAVAGRGVDRKHVVRVEAMNSVGKLYSLAYPEIENNDPSAIRHFSWIPTEILHMMSQGPDVKILAEHIMAEYILPLPAAGSNSKGNDTDESAWTDRLLNTMKYMDETAIKALLSLTGLKPIRPTLFDHFIDACIKNNGGVIDNDGEAITRRLNAVIQRLAATFSDPQKVAEDLHAFANLNEKRLYKLWATCLDTQTDLRTVVKSTHDFLKRLDQLAPSTSSTLTTLLRRSSLRVLNQSSVPTLLKKIQKHNNATSGQGFTAATNSMILLSFTSKHCPALYKLHVAELTKAIADERNARLAEVSLQALSSLMKWDSNLVVLDKRTHERIVRYALDSNIRPAKFAARLLAHSKEAVSICTEVVESIATTLPDAEPELLAAHVTALAQIARLVPDAFEHRSDAIMPFLLQNVLAVPEACDPEALASEEEWFEDDVVPPSLVARVQTLKVCRNRCLALSSTESALDKASSVIRMLFTLLEYGGTLNDEMVEDPKAKSRLRLQAAVSLLHLATMGAYVKAVSQKFVLLAITIQDTCYHVRVNFCSKLVSLLSPRKLPPRFNIIPFLTVHDPEEDVRKMAQAYVRFAYHNLSTDQRVEHFELLFFRLLHFLAHHPDFSSSHEDLPDIARYIDFYLDMLGTPETVSLLHHLASKAKTVRDADNQTESENLYIMSELAQELIKNRCHAHSWNLSTYPGKVKLPSDIVRPLPDSDIANRILKTVYLPDKTIAWLGEAGKHKGVAPPREKRERKIGTKRKASTRRSNGHAKRPRQRAKKKQSDESEGEGHSESASSDVEMANEDEGAGATSPDQDPSPERPERLGRGARTLAKARIRKQVKSES